MTQNEHVYAICCRLEVGGDVISGENVKTIEGYAVLHVEAATTTLVVFGKIKIIHLRNAQTTVGPLESHFRGQGAKMSNRLQNRK